MGAADKLKLFAIFDFLSFALIFALFFVFLCYNTNALINRL